MEWSGSRDLVSPQLDRLTTGSFDNWIAVRPAFLTDGKCEADKPEKKNGAYKIVEGDGYKGYIISRADIAHFIVEEAVLHWNKWKGKILAVGY